MPKIKVTSLVKGSYLRHKNKPQVVLSTAFHHPGRGGGVCQLKMRDLVSGNVIEETFKSNEQVELIDISSRELAFLYRDGDDCIFMDPRSYDQLVVPSSLLESYLQLLVADLKVYILFEDEQPLAVSFPPKVTLEVTEAPEAVAGNTVSGAKKTITLETGLEVLAPLFIKPGEKVIIDSQSRTYLSRAN